MKHHNVNYLRALGDSELEAYIENQARRAYAEANNTYRERLADVLNNLAKNCDESGGVMRLPVPMRTEVFHARTLNTSVICEIIQAVELTADQIRAIARFLR